MHAYYFDNEPTDQRLPHDYIPSRPVEKSTLDQLGVLSWHIPVVEGEYESKIDEIALKRNYKNRDVIKVTKEGLGDLYETKIKGFFEECAGFLRGGKGIDSECFVRRHLHEDEEIRYILTGSGYFDVREMPTDQWIRIAVESGDLLVLPAGIYHRFTLDTNNSLSAMRLFKEDPKWTPINRSAETDANPHRVEYLEAIRTAVA